MYQSVRPRHRHWRVKSIFFTRGKRNTFQSTSSFYGLYLLTSLLCCRCIPRCLHSKKQGILNVRQDNSLYTARVQLIQKKLICMKASHVTRTCLLDYFASTKLRERQSVMIKTKLLDSEWSWCFHSTNNMIPDAPLFSNLLFSLSVTQIHPLFSFAYSEVHRCSSR